MSKFSGSLKLIPVKRDPKTKKLIERREFLWTETAGGRSLNSNTIPRDEHIKWYQCKSAISANGNQCGPGTWIFAKSPFSAVQTVDDGVPLIIGKITELLQDTNATSAWAVLDIYSIEKERHQIYSMPILSRRLNEVSLAVVSISVCNNLSMLWFRHLH